LCQCHQHPCKLCHRKSPEGNNYKIQYACFESFPFRQKFFLFSSARPRDFDGMLGTGLPMSMYTMKTPIDMWRFNVPQLKEFFTFSVKDISIKLFYLYQRLQCTDYYFFKLSLFSLFIYCLDICLLSDRQGVPKTSIYSVVLLAFPYYNYL